MFTELSELSAETLTRESLRAPPACDGIKASPLAFEKTNGIYDGLGGLFFEENPSWFCRGKFPHGLEHSALSKSNYWRTTGQRLDNADAKILLCRKDETPRTPQVVVHHLGTLKT